MKATPRVLLTFLLGTSAACIGIVEAVPADDYELPAPDPSLDPARLRPGQIIASVCSLGARGNPLAAFEGVNEWRLVDIYIGSSPSQGLSPVESQWLETLGARVLFRFEVPAVRARVLESDIPRIIAAIRNGIVIRSVPDDTRYDIPDLEIGFSPRLTEAHLAALDSLGARVTTSLDFLDAVSATVPNRSVPALRARRDVRYADISALVCLARRAQGPSHGSALE